LVSRLDEPCVGDNSIGRIVTRGFPHRLRIRNIHQPMQTIGVGTRFAGRAVGEYLIYARARSGEHFVYALARIGESNRRGPYRHVMCARILEGLLRSLILPRGRWRLYGNHHLRRGSPALRGLATKKNPAEAGLKV
jgi:hypothetical protein